MNLKNTNFYLAAVILVLAVVVAKGFFLYKLPPRPESFWDVEEYVGNE